MGYFLLPDRYYFRVDGTGASWSYNFEICHLPVELVPGAEAGSVGWGLIQTALPGAEGSWEYVCVCACAFTDRHRGRYTDRQTHPTCIEEWILEASKVL